MTLSTSNHDKNFIKKTVAICNIVSFLNIDKYMSINSLKRNYNAKGLTASTRVYNIGTTSDANLAFGAPMSFVIQGDKAERTNASESSE